MPKAGSERSRRINLVTRLEAELLSLFVQAEYRNQGIATNLLNKIEQILAQRGCQKVTIVYMTGKPTTPVLEHLLQKYHWSKPESRMLVCKTDIRILNAPWIEMYEKLPSSFTIFPWCELTDRERATIQKQQEQENWIREDLIPFKYEQDMEALTSLGLRYQGQVVGWLISHRIAPDTIRYSCGWVKEDLQKTGCLLALIVKASKRQARAKIPNALWSVPVEFANKVRFDQFMRDYFSSVAETRGAFKTIC